MCDLDDDLRRLLTRFKLPNNGKISVDWWGNRVWTESEQTISCHGIVQDLTCTSDGDAAADYAGIPYIPEPISP